MAQLRELMEALGYTGVETLLQSGNVVFGSKEPAATSERRIAERLHDETGLDVKVLVRTARGAGARSSSATRCASTPTIPSTTTWCSSRPGPTRSWWRPSTRPTTSRRCSRLHGRELFMWWPAGVHKARLTHSFWERKLKVTATARNWNTVERLLELAGSDGPV